MRQLLGTAGLYLAAAMLASGWVMGTCTQDSTDALLAAAVFGLGLTGASGLLMAFRPLTGLTLTLAAPAALLHLLQLSRTAEAMVAYTLLGRSFCEQIHGLPYGRSGDEPLLMILWSAHALLVASGLAAAAAQVLDRPRRQGS